MRIAIVHSFYSSRQPSGENSVVRAEVDALRRAGHEVQLFAARTDEAERAVSYRLRTAFRVASGRGHSPYRSLSAFNPDLVYVHNLFPNFSTQWLRNVECPLLVSAHNYRSMCANGLLFRDGHICTDCPDGARWAGLRHGCYRNSRVASLPIAVANRRGCAADPLLSRATLIRVQSERQAEVFRSAGIPAEDMVIVPGFIPDDLDPGVPSGQARSGWLFAGRLTPEKGVLELAERWPAGLRLTIAGDGPLKESLKDRARSEFTLLGNTTRDRVVQLMRSSNALVFPSQWYETFGTVYAEALACGLPVLALGPNCVAEHIKREGTGWNATFEDDVEELVRRADSEANTLRTSCRQAFEANYSERRWLAQMQELLEKTLYVSHRADRRTQTVR